MSTPMALYNRILKMDTNQVINESLDETLGDLADINVERMNEGLRADNSVQENYSFISQVVYGYPDAPIKLKATGAFQAGVKATRNGDTITTTSSDPKTEKLERKYGKEYGTSVFGTSGEFKKQYQVDHFIPALHKKITSATGLKFTK